MVVFRAALEAVSEALRGAGDLAPAGDLRFIGIDRVFSAIAQSGTFEGDAGSRPVKGTAGKARAALAGHAPLVRSKTVVKRLPDRLSI
ncbi:MAG: hypothetical protein CMH88_15085 [Oceanibulbus sp.]|jgi:hypothetical protein|nr:hypothetical protein [Sulfitobacter sp.]